MYLALLNQKQKELFLGLAFKLASTDGQYSDEEKLMMNEYCKEMNITMNLEWLNKPIEIITEELNNCCNLREKKIIIFEAIGLAILDGHYDTSERGFIQSIVKLFGLDYEYSLQCERALSDYLNLQKRIDEMVMA